MNGRKIGHKIFLSERETVVCIVVFFHFMGNIAHCIFNGEHYLAADIVIRCARCFLQEALMFRRCPLRHRSSFVDIVIGDFPLTSNSIVYFR